MADIFYDDKLEQKKERRVNCTEHLLQTKTNTKKINNIHDAIYGKTDNYESPSLVRAVCNIERTISNASKFLYTILVLIISAVFCSGIIYSDVNENKKDIFELKKIIEKDILDNYKG